jgi:WD40 repeat protein
METVMPLSPAELERVISGPADRVGVNLEPGLISEIVTDVSDEPGALPLLQYALTELFENRKNGRLTSQAYRAVGGVAGALGRSAEREYILLDKPGRDAVKQVFLRLVTVGEGAEETRRRVLQAEINALSENVQAVTEAYGQARLLSFDRDPVTRGPTVEVAHEALLREWPRLSRWLEENRADLRLQSILAIATGEWRESGDDSSFLLLGSRLDQFEGWAASTDITLAKDETEFLEASLAKRKERRAAEETRRQKELDAARQLAQAERSRAEEQTRASSRLRRLAGVLGLTLLVALILSFFAFQQSKIAEGENRLAASRELAAASVSNLETDPELSILLAMDAISATYDVDDIVTEEAESALHQAIQASRIRNSLTGSGNFVFSGGQEFDFSGEALVVPESDGKLVFYTSSGFYRQFSISGHRGEVIGYSRASRLIAVGSQDGEVRVWDFPGDDFIPLDLFDPPEEKFVFDGQSGEITFITFNKSGTILATASVDRSVKVWDLESGEELLTLAGHGGTVNAVAFHPLGTYIATASSDQKVKFWDLGSGDEVRTISGHSDHVVDVAFSYDGNQIATTSRDGTAKLWETSTGEELITFRGHSGSVNAVAFSPAGDLLVTGGEDATARVWDLPSGEELIVLTGHKGPIFHIVFSPITGTPVATSSLDGTAKAWDIRPEGSREWLTLSGHSEVVFDVAYNPDGNRLASASWDGSAIIWNALSGSKLLNLAGHSAEVTAVGFSPDGERLVSSSFDGMLKLWDAFNGEELLSIDAHSGRIHDVVFDKEGARLASAGEDGQVKIWDVSSGMELLSWVSGSRLINRLAFTHDGERIASAGKDGTAKIWDSFTGEMQLSLSGHSAEVLNVSFSPDDDRLATAGGDGVAKVWDVESGKELYSLTGHGTSVWAAAFSPDGSRIATMSLDKTAKLWDAETGDELLNLINYNDGRDLAFSPNGNHLAVASGDGSVRVYVLPIEDLMALARLRLTRPLTDEECQRYLHVLECPTTR